jgi:hypothetical protein
LPGTGRGRGRPPGKTAWGEALVVRITQHPFPLRWRTCWQGTTTCLR